MAAALGITQLARLDQFNARRSALVKLYKEKLADIGEIKPLADPPCPIEHARHLFIVRVDSAKIGRDAFMAELKKRNIGTGLHFRCIHLQKYYRETMNMRPGMLPDTEWNSDRICSLPLFPDMTGEDVDDVVSAIREVLAL